MFRDARHWGEESPRGNVRKTPVGGRPNKRVKLSTAPDKEGGGTVAFGDGRFARIGIRSDSTRFKIIMCIINRRNEQLYLYSERLLYRISSAARRCRIFRAKSRQQMFQGGSKSFNK